MFDKKNKKGKGVEPEIAKETMIAENIENVNESEPVITIIQGMRVFFPDESATCNPDEITVGCIAKNGDKVIDDGDYNYGGVIIKVVNGKVDTVIQPPSVG